MEALVRGLPAAAERIRRQFWRDERLRALCEDYRDVCETVSRLEAASAPDAQRVAEYRELAAELLAEAGDLLQGEPR